MNQIARGGYSLTPPEGGTTGVPLASGLRDQTPPSSSTLPGRVKPPTPLLASMGGNLANILNVLCWRAIWLGDQWEMICDEALKRHSIYIPYGVLYCTVSQVR